MNLDKDWRRAVITAPPILMITGLIAFMAPHDLLFLLLAITYAAAFGGIALLALLRGGWKQPGALFFTGMFVVFTVWLFYVLEVTIGGYVLPFGIRRTLYWLMFALAFLAMEYYPWRREDVVPTSDDPIPPAARLIPPVASNTRNTAMTDPSHPAHAGDDFDDIDT